MKHSTELVFYYLPVEFSQDSFNPHRLTIKLKINELDSNLYISYQDPSANSVSRFEDLIYTFVQLCRYNTFLFDIDHIFWCNLLLTGFQKHCLHKRQENV